MTRPEDRITNELAKAARATEIAESVPEDLALAVYYALESRFGYTSAMWDRESVHNMAGRPLTDDEWAKVVDSEWWLTDIGEIAYDAVRDASAISLMLADLDIL